MDRQLLQDHIDDLSVNGELELADAIQSLLDFFEHFLDVKARFQEHDYDPPRKVDNTEGGPKAA